MNFSAEIFKLAKRAENYDVSHLAITFVDVGHLYTILANQEHQILFGRRGTGKTHVLSYHLDKAHKRDEVAVQIDMRTLGSTGGIYGDTSINIQERATRLLVDTLSSIHNEILTLVAYNDRFGDFSKIGPKLDALADACLDVKVVGDVELETKTETGKNESSSLGGSATLSQNPSLNLALGSNSGNSASKSESLKVKGREHLRVHFGRVHIAFKELVETFSKKPIWIHLDEWSEIPLDIQPYLADFLRRCMFPLPGISVKIAAIDLRCNFCIYNEGIGYIGIEPGADAATAVSLDEYMVFDNNADLAKKFFKNMLYRHVKAIFAQEQKTGLPATADDFINACFARETSFEEFVRASEGIPRDGINIISLAVQKAIDGQINVADIRTASRSWYLRSKEHVVQGRPEALSLLKWIISEVIGHRQARAFLLNSETRDSLINFLYDNRVIHLIKNNIAGHDMPGEKFNVYSIDYGCYVDLINTSRAPKGLFLADKENGEQFIDVPENDYRSIRRSILDLNLFYTGISPEI